MSAELRQPLQTECCVLDHRPKYTMARPSIAYRSCQDRIVSYTFLSCLVSPTEINRSRTGRVPGVYMRL